MTTREEIYAAIKSADAAGDSASVQKLGSYLKTLPTADPAAKAAALNLQQAKDRETYDPTKDMSGLERFVAGYGKAVPDIVRGVGQRLGLVDQATIDEHKRLDAPLMNTDAGMAGNITGNVAAAAPTVAIPGAATIRGAAMIGGGLGLAQPTASTDSGNLLGLNIGAPAKNALEGGALGAGSVAAGRLLGAGYRGLKAIAEPFTATGPQAIAGRTIQRFADNPASVAGVTNKPTVTGSLPTLAEQTGDRGIAQLQDALRAADPQMANALAWRASANNAARVNSLRTMAGQDGARDFAVAERAGTAGPMYKEAFKVVPDAAGLTPTQSSTMETLMKSPAIKSAMADAREIAANRGTNVGPTNGSIEGLHNMKTAMDDAINAAKLAGNDTKAASITDAQKRLVGLIEDISPEYGTARKVYADMSKPINQMDVAAQLAKRGLSNGSDLSGNPTINRNALLGALKDEPALVRQATGRPLGDLSKVMTPEQLSMIRSIASETDRAGAVAAAGNGLGSATAQRLASQNILRQAITPNGASAAPSFGQKIGQAVVDNTLANTVVGKATNWIYSGIAEPKIQQALLKATLQPEEAQAAIAAAQKQGIKLPDNLLTRLAGQARRVAGVSTANASRQP